MTKKNIPDLSNARFVFEQMTEEVHFWELIKDKKGKIKTWRLIYANPSAVKKWGYSSLDEVVNMTTDEIFGEGAAQHYMPIVEKIMKEGKTHTFQDYFPHLDRYFRFTTVPLQDSFITTGYDITEDKNEIKRIERQKYLLEKSQELGKIGTWELDIINNKLTWTDETCRIFGVPEGTLPNYEIFLDKVHPDDREYVEREWSKGMKGKTYDIEHRIVRDGKIFWVREKADVTFNKEGVAISAIGFTQDITFQRNLETELLQSQKLESIGQLAGGIAHDFNNLLTVINGYSEIALKTLPEDEPAKRDIHQVLNAGKKASNLTNQLLAFSRKQLMKAEEIDLQDILENLSKMLNRLVSENIELIINTQVENCFVYADVGQIEQVIFNLSVNAKDALPDGGIITFDIHNEIITKPQTDILDLEPGPYVILEISDNGVGMDPNTIKRIFEPFYTTKKVGEGTGLGLSTVHGIIKQSNGNITVSSKKGEGTAFRIYLPRVEKIKNVKVDADEISTYDNKGTETILVVEDEPQVMEVIVSMLEPLGYKVIKVQNGIEAIELLKTKDLNVDLILTDMIMPKMSGVELSIHLNKHYEDIKVLFMSGYTEDEIGNRIQSQDNFISKPFTLSQLTKKIREMLD